jgi:uncharacterized protein
MSVSGRPCARSATRVDALPEPLATIAASDGAPGLTLRDHGPRHWKCVALTGLELASRDRGVDLATVIAFAQLHDSQRLNEFHDPQHGPRAAAIASAAIAAGRLPGFDAGTRHASQLVEAIRDHTTSARTADPTIGACWDADRFNLWRVGIEPSVEFISTAAGCTSFVALSAYARSLIEGPEPTWNEVIARTRQ